MVDLYILAFKSQLQRFPLMWSCDRITTAVGSPGLSRDRGGHENHETRQKSHKYVHKCKKNWNMTTRYTQQRPECVAGTGTRTNQ